MAVIRNEIPILEYDGEQRAVLMPDREKLYKFPEKAVFPFLADEVDKFALSHGGKIEGEFLSATKTFPIYTVNYMGEEIVLCQAPVGAAASAQILDFLIGYGCRKIISSGSCGALCDIPENEFLIPTMALRCEGTSYHYLPPSRWIRANSSAITAIEKALEKNGYKYSHCKTWTTDGFFRETRDMVKLRKEEGCSVVEMECSALMACAQFRGAVFGQLLFTADTLADVENHDNREWGISSFPVALKLCFDAVLEL